MKSKIIVFVCLFATLLVGVAAAEPSAEVKAAKGIEKRQPVDEGTTFTAGETVYAWSNVLDAKGERISHVWKKDGTEIWKTTFTAGSKRWRYNSRRRFLKAGSYTVEVVTEDGTKLGEVAFTVE